MSAENNLNKVEPVKSEIEIHWEELIKNMDRSLMLCDMDFSDLTAEDEINVLIPQGLMKTAIPPPPPLGISSLGVLSPFVTTNRGPSGMNVRENILSESKQNTSTKSKKTVNYLSDFVKKFETSLKHWFINFYRSNYFGKRFVKT